MDGWKTIKNVRIELAEAHSQAKQGHTSTASACMRYAGSLLEKYKKEEKGPDHGFKDQGSR